MKSGEGQVADHKPQPPAKNVCQKSGEASSFDENK